jgi:excinuclease UvrABC nuclease subunit
MKVKNTFSKLRKQKNEIQNKLNFEVAEKNRHYENYINEVSKRNKLESYYKASLFGFSTLVLVLVVLLIKG